MMAHPSRRLWTAVLAAALTAAGGCGGSGGAPPTPLGMAIGTQAPEFSLPDVNPASSTFATDVSPSQALGSASAWYFGHST